jgi:anti-sigma B factor antagonist
MSTDGSRPAALRLIDGIPVVAVVGEVDIANRNALEDAILSAAEEDAGAVVVSLEEATYFDSAIIHVLMRGRSQLRTNRQALVLVSPSLPAGRRVLEIAGLLDSRATFDTTEAAIVAAKALRADRGSF